MKEAAVNYRLSRNELSVLLCGLGAKGLFGFLPEEQTTPSRADVVRSVGELYRKGLLLNGEQADTLSIQPPLSAWLRRCIDADRILYVTPRDGSQLCYYLDERGFTMIEPVALHDDQFRVFGGGRRALIPHWKEKGLLPAIHDEEVHRMQETLSGQTVRSAGDDEATEDWLVEIERTDLRKGREPPRRLRIFSSALDYRIWLCDEAERQVLLYSQARLLEFVTNRLGGKRT